jgi:glycosyltransferase involved in cell wall biosynthesis
MMRRSPLTAAGQEPDAAPPLWIAWAPHAPRSRRLAAALGAEMRCIHFLAFQRPWLAPCKYPAQAFVTWRLLWRRRPRLVLVQNPPIFAALLVALYARLARGRFIIDAHTGALVGRKWGWSLPLHRWLSRRAQATLVTNAALRDLLQRGRSSGAPVLIVEDPPVELNPAPSDRPPASGARQVVVIATYGPDEPIAALLAAARQLPEVTFAITGDARRLPPSLRAACPRNVQLTGWLSDADYSALVCRANVVVVLTVRDHTLLSGAWEALYAGQPLVTSDWPVLRMAFPQGTVFTHATPEAIRAAVCLALDQEDQLRTAMQELAEHKRQAWEMSLVKLRHLLTGTGAMQGKSGEQCAGCNSSRLTR